MNTKRESGFYWCKYKSMWIACHWNVDCWDIPGTSPTLIFTDRSFDEIDERRIVRDETKNEDK